MLSILPLRLLDLFSSAAAEEADRRAFPPIPAAGFRMPDPAEAVGASPRLDEAGTHLLAHLRTALPTVQMLALAETATGILLGADHSGSSPAEAPRAAVAHYARLIRTKQQAVSAPQRPGEQMQEMILTLTDEVHFVRLIRGGAHLLYAVAPRDLGIGVLRQAIITHCEYADNEDAAASKS